MVPRQYVYTRAATGNTWSVSADTLRNEGLYAGVYCSHGVEASFNVSVRCHGNILLFEERVQEFQFVDVVLSLFVLTHALCSLALLASQAKTEALAARKSCAVFLLRSFGPMGL